MNANRAISKADCRRIAVLMLFGVLVVAVLAIKSFNDEWFVPRTPLELNNQHALVFFTLERGCDCQMRVVRAAEAQLASWPAATDSMVPTLRVDFNRRPDLARQYGVARSPALVLLDSMGRVVWKQDVGLSEDAPLDLIQAQRQIEILNLSGE
jgi:hypothetical protein